jgi:hypothetical protein
VFFAGCSSSERNFDEYAPGDYLIEGSVVVNINNKSFVEIIPHDVLDSVAKVVIHYTGDMATLDHKVKKEINEALRVITENASLENMLEVIAKNANAFKGESVRVIHFLPNGKCMLDYGERGIPSPVIEAALSSDLIGCSDFKYLIARGGVYRVSIGGEEFQGGGSQVGDHLKGVLSCSGQKISFPKRAEVKKFALTK